MEATNPLRAPNRIKIFFSFKIKSYFKVYFKMWKCPCIKLKRCSIANKYPCQFHRKLYVEIRTQQKTGKCCKTEQVFFTGLSDYGRILIIEVQSPKNIHSLWSVLGDCICVYIYMYININIPFPQDVTGPKVWLCLSLLKSLQWIPLAL